MSFFETQVRRAEQRGDNISTSGVSTQHYAINCRADTKRPVLRLRYLGGPAADATVAVSNIITFFSPRERVDRLIPENR